ncbi:hypothetical protein GIB67_018468, partial [Kingdonia uniflora]
IFYSRSLLAASYPSQKFKGYLKAHSIHKQALQEYTRMMLRRRSLDTEQTTKTNSTSVTKASKMKPRLHISIRTL